MANANSQFQMLQEIVKKLRGTKSRETDNIERDPRESIDEISPIDRHSSSSPDMTIVPEQSDSEAFKYESPPAK